MKPNILWLTLESVRAGHTSVYGYHKNTTPFLEKISQRAEATVLDPMIASSMWTPASTASMLTGTHLSTHQLGQDGKASIHSRLTSIRFQNCWEIKSIRQHYSARTGTLAQKQMVYIESYKITFIDYKIDARIMR